jgi:predicted PurR-regulated permease PerM
LSFALFLAFLYDPLVIPLEKKGMKRPAAAILVFSIGFLITILLGYFYISFLIEEFRNIQVSLPEYASRLYGYIPYKVKVFFDIDTPEKIDAHINQGIFALRGASMDVFRQALLVLKKAFDSTLSFVLATLGYLIIPVYLFYFMKDLPNIRESAIELIPPVYRDKVIAGASEIHDVLSAFLRGQLAVCAIMACLYSVGLYFIGIDLALAIGSLAGIAFIIPYLGTIIGIILSMTMAALKFQDLLHPLLCLGWFGIVQGLEGGFITPRIVGEKVGLHPVVVILVLMIGGEMFGVFGMLLAVPVTAVLNVLLRHFLESYRKSEFYLKT